MSETTTNTSQIDLMALNKKASIEEHQLSAQETLDADLKHDSVTNVAKQLRNLSLNESQHMPKETQAKKLDSLEQWANKLFDTESPTVSLGRYGMKTPADVIKFIKSPAGEVLIGEMKTQYAEELRTREEIQLKQREEGFFKLLLRVALILMYIENKAHASDKVKELVLEQNKKSVELAKKVSTPSELNIQKQHKKQLASDYDKAINSMAQRQDSLNTDMAELQLEQQHLEQIATEIDSKFAHFAKALNANELYDEESSLDALKEHSATIEHELEAVYNQLDINPDDAVAKMQASKLNLQLVDLRDRIDVLKGNKYLVNAQGEEVSSFKDHAFILDPKMKLVVENGVNYLIRQNQDWEKVKENPEDKHRAQQKAESLDNMGAKKICQHHHRAELTKHQSFFDVLAHKIAHCIEEQLTVKNQMLLLQGAKASAQNLMNEPGLSHQAPTPAPTLKAHAQPSLPQNVTLQYKEQIQEIKSLTDYSQWWKLEPGLPKGVRAEIQKQEEFRNMPRSGPIPQLFKEFMLRTLERFNVDATRPNITAIKSPTDIKLEQQHQSTAPSPFGMKPTPFK